MYHDYTQSLIKAPLSMYLDLIELVDRIVLGTRPSEKRKEGLGNRLGQKCTIWNVFFPINYLPPNAGLVDFSSPTCNSACTLISGKRLTV